MKFTFANLLAVLITTAFVTGCATITRGTSEEFTITSEPSGADILLSIGPRCQTPCTVEVKRRSEFLVVASLDGYKEVRTKVGSQIAAGGTAAMAGSAILGPIGLVVDGSRGSIYELNPNPLHIVFEKKDKEEDTDEQAEKE